MKRLEIKFITFSYLIWGFVLCAILFFAIKFYPVRNDFLGGGHASYIQNPFFWAWSNFDGEHYVAIAKEGYKPLTYFFFPLFPLLIKNISIFFGSGINALVSSGILISNTSFVIALIGLYKLLKLDIKESTIKTTILLLLVFPTSFYFGGVYTESLFLALTVWSLLFARQKKWLLAGILAALASATRVIGLALIAALFVELYLSYKNKSIRNWTAPILSILVSFFGIGLYMYYLWIKTGDPLNFLNTVAIFGPQRSSTLVILPQVFYRYIFKILPNLNYSVLTSFFPPILEIVTGTLFLVLAVLSFWKTRLSFAVYLALGYIIPTLSGSFSSFPRYVLVLFPGFIVLAKILSNRKYLLFAFYTLCLILLVISFSLFSRGWWIS